MTLFASIFFFVNTFPRPPPQPANQFQAYLGYGGPLGNKILSVSVLHLAGPTVTGPTTAQAAVYLQSSAKPTAFSGPFTLASGLNGSTVWQLGQTWKENLTSYALTIPDNLTLSIIWNSQLIFRVTLPGANPNIPPEFISAGTTPAEPFVGQSFQVFAQITDDDLNPNSVFVNLSQIPGNSGSGLHKMVFIPATGLWVYNVTSGAKSAATFFVFINATDLVSQQNSVAFPVTVSAGGTTGGSAFAVLLSSSATLPVNRTALTLKAFVTNTLNSSQLVSVSFSVNGVAIGTAPTQTIAPGATAIFSQGWTPNFVGDANFVALASSATTFSTGTLSLTVSPRILFVAHDVPLGTSTIRNESALLAQEIASAGFPFTTMFVPCTAALPSSATFQSYDVVVIDFGSATGLACTSGVVPPSTTEQAKITGASGVSFWVVGADAFSQTACSSYSAAYLSMFNIRSATTCTTAVAAATTSLTYTASAANRLLNAGLSGLTLTLNQTLHGSTAFQPYFYFTNGATSASNAWLSDASAHVVGTWASGTTRQVALATDPALLRTPLPTGSSWGSGAAGSAVVYNVMNFLCRLATTSTPIHGEVDFSVGAAVLVGQAHSATTKVYGALRANGVPGGFVTATLYVNGSVAFFQGQAVQQSVTLAGNGSWVWVTLTWQAPTGGPYTLTVVLASSPVDLYLGNNQIGTTVLNQPTTFS